MIANSFLYLYNSQKKPSKVGGNYVKISTVTIICSSIELFTVGLRFELGIVIYEKDTKIKKGEKINEKIKNFIGKCISNNVSSNN